LKYPIQSTSDQIPLSHEKRGELIIVKNIKSRTDIEGIKAAYFITALMEVWCEYEHLGGG
jgi:hypothetical protein